MNERSSLAVGSGKRVSLILLLIAQVAGMSLWFITAAVLPDLVEEAQLSAFRQAALSSGVQAGVVVGALISAVFGLADRFDPRRVFAISAISAGVINALLLVIDVGWDLAILLRVATGALLAGVYPVDENRGWLGPQRSGLSGRCLGWRADAWISGTAPDVLCWRH